MMNACIICSDYHCVMIYVWLFLEITRAQVLGVDLGHLYWKAATIAPSRPFTIVENEKSNRKSYTTLSLRDGVRSFDEEALKISLKSPSNVFSYLKGYFPLTNMEQADTFQQLHFEHNTMAWIQSLHFNYSKNEQQDQLTLQQMQGVIFSHIRKLATAKEGGSKIDAVLTVPSHWQLSVRQKLVNAAAIGGLSVLAVVSENTAAAVQYSLSRADAQEEATILLVNLGFEELQLSLVQLSSVFDPASKKSTQVVKMLAEQTIGQLGGFYYDLLIFQYIKKKHKQQLMDNPKAIRKAFRTSQKVKEALSASKEMPIFIEQLTPGHNFQAQISRSLFNQQAHDLVKKTLSHIHTFVQSSKVPTSVQLIGGGIRVPYLIEAIVKQFKGIQVGTHINGDEAMALGAAFIAANLTSTYKVKKVKLITPIHSHLTYSFNQTQQPLFQEAASIGSTINISTPVSSQMRQLNLTIFKEGQPLLLYRVPNLDLSVQGMAKKNATSFKLELTLRVDSFHPVEVIHSQLVGQQNKTIRKSRIIKNQDNAQSQNTTLNDSSIHANEEASEVDNETTTRSKKVRREYYNTTELQTYRADVKCRVHYLMHGLYNESQVSRLKVELNKFDKVDKEIKNLAEKKSGYESLIYSYQELLDDEHFLPFVSAEEMPLLKESIQENKFWLQEKGDIARLGEFVLKKKLLMSDFQKPLNRSSEFNSRRRILQETRKKVMSHLYKLQKFNVTKPWLPKEQVESVIRFIQEGLQKFSAGVEQSEKMSKEKDGRVMGWEMQEFREEAKKRFIRLDTKPKPKKKQKAKPQKKSPKEQQQQEQDYSL